jgi:hypothetical protein
VTCILQDTQWMGTGEAKSGGFARLVRPRIPSGHLANALLTTLAILPDFFFPARSPFPSPFPKKAQHGRERTMEGGPRTD